MERVYADFNGTSPLSRGALEALQEAFVVWGNPSSVHRDGRQALEKMEESRRLIARSAGVSPLEVVFTSGGSESNTFALLGSYFNSPTSFRLLTTSVEHSSVRDTAQFLKNGCAPVDFLQVDRKGQLSLNDLEKRIAEFKPSLVSVMAANNETGVIFPLRQIYEICQKQNICFHTDAVQAFGKLPPSEWNSADLISITAHKIHGPKGVGALIVRKGTALRAIHYGGAQEIKRRGGTENIPGILGFAAACSELMGPEDWDKLRKLRDYFENQLLELLPGIFINGLEPRIPNTSSFRIEGVASEVLLGALDLDGISISVGSACSSGSISPSHVLLAMGLTPREAKECIRVSWGKTTTSQDIDRVLESVVRHVHRIRERKKAHESK